MNRAASPGECVFFVRSENDLDHSAPVLDALARRGRLPLRVVEYGGLKSLAGDFRLRYLRREYGLAACHVFTLPEAVGWRRWVLPRVQRLYQHLLSRDDGGSGFISRLRRKVRSRLARWLRRNERNLDGGAVLGALDRMGRPAALVFDHTVNNLASTMAPLARERGLPLLAVPHSISHLRNFPGGLAEMDLGGTYDHVLVPNQAVAGRVMEGEVPARVVTVLGSPRFSRQWTEVLSRIQEPYQDERPGLKVLFILSKAGKYVDREAVRSLVARLRAEPGLALLVKLHTRNEEVSLPFVGQGPPPRLAGPELPTPPLIDWADVVLFWGSSVIYDALRKGKPSLFLRYLFQLDFDFEDTITGWAVHGEDEVLDRLKALARGENAAYPPDEALRCLDKYVDAGFSEVPLEYARFIEGAAGVAK